MRRGGKVWTVPNHTKPNPLAQGTSKTLHQSAVDGAIEEMLFTGGALNLKLLGGPAAESTMK
jgi:hypothetical protein